MEESSQLKLVETTAMNLLITIALATLGVAAAEPGFGRYYGGYGGYRHYGKRSADADAVAEADAEPGFGRYYGGYSGYAGHGYGGYRHYGKRSADAEAEPGFGRYYGRYYGGYLGYAGHGYGG